MSLTYKDAGVDTHKAGQILSQFAQQLNSRPKDPAVLGGIGPFASLYHLGPALAQLEDPVLVSCCDGVGTKLLLAKQWGNFSGLGVDLVAMNVNDLLCVGATPLFFLDYYACSQLQEAETLEVLSSIQVGCEQAQCSLIGGETAELPGLYQKGEFDLAGFSVGLVDRKKLLGPHRVEEGDVVIAIGSSGFHSNGYSLVRKLVEKEKLNPAATPSFSDQSWSSLLLAPTKIYVNALRPLLGEFHALAHITGGGLDENLPRVLPDQMSAELQLDQWSLPPLFEWAKSSAGLDRQKTLATFNCGVGMIAIAPAEKTDLIVSALKQSGEKAWPIGRILTRKDAEQNMIQWR